MRLCRESRETYSILSSHNYKRMLLFDFLPDVFGYPRFLQVSLTTIYVCISNDNLALNITSNSFIMLRFSYVNIWYRVRQFARGARIREQIGFFYECLLKMLNVILECLPDAVYNRLTIQMVHIWLSHQRIRVYKIYHNREGW